MTAPLITGRYTAEGDEMSDLRETMNKRQDMAEQTAYEFERSTETVEKIKARRYECFMEDHEEKPWTPGQCAGYAGKGSLSQHLFRCKRKDGHGLGGLFCKQHAKTGGF